MVIQAHQTQMDIYPVKILSRAAARKSFIIYLYTGRNYPHVIVVQALMRFLYLFIEITVQVARNLETFNILLWTMTILGQPVLYPKMFKDA